MGGTNPYIEKADYERPTKPYTVTFIFPDKTEKKVQVDPDKIPYGETGLPGSLLDIAMGNGIELEHVCGGVCACSTCHVMVKQGLETCNEGTDDEFDQLEEAPAVTIRGRKKETKTSNIKNKPRGKYFLRTQRAAGIIKIISHPHPKKTVELKIGIKTFSSTNINPPKRYCGVIERERSMGRV